ncbi:MAG TPA: monovalent cation/H+ antiporter complex subunit F [Ktedonobacterales bacterium]|nr:monovalent cation/H+ antiporter complex subunit F [Ktedonobacterales bacterium]
MNAWLIAALALLPGFVACGVVLWRATVLDAVAALNLAGVLAALELILLAEGLHRSPFYDLALVLALLACVGGLVFARFLERWV